MSNVESGEISLSLKKRALDSFEKRKGEWLWKARQIAIDICKKHGSATIDDVRRKCPPPKDTDPRIMGAVFNNKMFEPIDMVNSNRVACHKRPIRVFGLSDIGQMVCEFRKG